MPAAPATVALYLTDLAEVAKTSTVERRIASIAFCRRRRAAGQLSPTDDPTAKAVWAGIGCTAPQRIRPPPSASPCCAG
jgi:hypothetical protein